MAVVIRLRQEGCKGHPIFRVVAADSRFPREGRFLDIVGTYDPSKEKNGSTINLEKVDSWISKGAKPSPTVNSLIKKARATATVTA